MDTGQGLPGHFGVRACPPRAQPSPGSHWGDLGHVLFPYLSSKPSECVCLRMVLKNTNVLVKPPIGLFPKVDLDLTLGVPHLF